MSSKPTLLEAAKLTKRYRFYGKPSDRFWDALLARLPGRLGSKRRGQDFVALDAVSFDVRRGETLGIIGRNGAGKSTLLQVLCGVTAPSSGTLTVNGRVSALLELGAGFNPQFTGRENVFLSGSILGLSQKEIATRFAEIEAFAEIGAFMDQPVSTYSSGMYVRLAFALAIHVEPEILVVDEALAVGDTAFQTKCLTRIRGLQKAGVTIILVSHSANIILEYCDRALYLRQGRLMADGPARDVLALYHADLVLDEGGWPMQQAAPQPKIEPAGDEEHPPSVLSSGASITSVLITDARGLPKRHFEFGEVLKVCVSFETAVTIEKPCAGIEIKSTNDIVLWTGTTDGMGVHSQSLGPGRHSVVWTLRCNAAGNRYVLAAGIGDISTGTYRRLARLAYAGYFDIAARPRAGHGWLEPAACATFEQAKEPA